MIYIGVDPGISGGVAACDNHGHFKAWGMPETEKDIYQMFRDLGSAKNTCALIERVHSMPAQGIVSAFTFGKGYGGLRMAMVASFIPFEEVTSRVWQQALGCLSGGDKNVTKARAQQLFPNLKITHAIADALLICEYLRRLKNGELTKK